MTAGHVLICRLDNDGDVLLAGPAVRAAAASADRVTFLCGPRGRRAAALLPGVDDVLVHRAAWIDPSGEALDPDATAGLVEELAGRGIDLAMVLTSFHQSSLPMALLLRMAGVPTVTAISDDYPGSLLDVRHRLSDDVHEVERNLSLAAASGFRLPAGDDGRLAVRRSADAARAAAALLAPLDGAPYVVVHPGASVAARAWDPLRCAALVEALRDTGWGVVVTAGPEERSLAAFVAGARGEEAQPGGVVDLGGRTDLAELAEVLAGADAVAVGNTGPAHLAAAVGTPVVSLFAPTVPAARWRPWGVPHELLGDQEIACAGCRATTCPVPGHPCLGAVAVTDVVAAVRRLVASRDHLLPATATRGTPLDHEAGRDDSTSGSSRRPGLTDSGSASGPPRAVTDSGSASGRPDASAGERGHGGAGKRILVWHVHGSYLTALLQGQHTYLLPVLADRGPDGRGRARTWDWPPNAVEVTPAEAAQTDVDVVILQRPEELHHLAADWLGGRRPGVDVPAIYLEHNAPQGRINDLRHPAADRPELHVVHVTAFNALFWDTGSTPTTVIDHGIVDPGYRYTGELPHLGVVTNEPVRRARVTGTDLLPRLAAAAPVDLFGMQVSAFRVPGITTHEDLPQERLHAELARRRVYVHPIRWTSLGLSLLEAMHLGMPVVALATTEVVEAVPPEAGVLSTRLDTLVEAARRYVADPELAREHGRAARRAALERYGLDRFLSDWDRLVKEVAG